MLRTMSVPQRVPDENCLMSHLSMQRGQTEDPGDAPT